MVKMIRSMTGLFLVLMWLLFAFAPCCPAAEKLTLQDAWQVIKTKRFIDLTHAFAPGIPHWPGFPDEKRETLYWYEPGKGKLGSVFMPSPSRTWASGGPTWTRRLTLPKVGARWIRSTSKKCSCPWWSLMSMRK